MQRGRELVSGRNLSFHCDSFGHHSLLHSQIWSGEDQICHHIALTIHGFYGVIFFLTSGATELSWSWRGSSGE